MEAQPDLERALSLSPEYAPALALQSIVTLVQNEKSKAMEIAQRAVQADIISLSGWPFPMRNKDPSISMEH